ncbi:MAG TPA: MOSC domain-containing protein [Burkholderiales bacterium]|nr:MOSC domain-containing protein [Burkholderiales bacterium]
MSAFTVAALAVYPVKGAAAVALQAFEVQDCGPDADRRYCLVRPGGRVFTQRDDPGLARLRAALRGEHLSLEFDGEQLAVGPGAFVATAEIRVWSRSATARVADAGTNACVSQWFGTPLLLAKLEHPLQREGAALAFGDAAALLVANLASLDALNAALLAPVPMDRFRPNIIVGGAAAYAEDGWRKLRVGGALLAPVHPCGRCQVTTIDQEFGAVLGDEPLRTLARLRTRDGEAVFGVRYAVERPGRVRVGDRVEPLDQ